MSELELELHRALSTVRVEGRLIPLLDKHYPVDDVDFRPMPQGILDILATSTGYREINSGDEPTWLKISTDGAGELALVVYRATIDEALYVLGPRRPTLQ